MHSKSKFFTEMTLKITLNWNIVTLISKTLSAVYLSAHWVEDFKREFLRTSVHYTAEHYEKKVLGIGIYFAASFGIGHCKKCKKKKMNGLQSSDLKHCYCSTLYRNSCFSCRVCWFFQVIYTFKHKDWSNNVFSITIYSI